jgi:hypothetical protein
MPAARQHQRLGTTVMSRWSGPPHHPRVIEAGLTFTGGRQLAFAGDLAQDLGGTAGANAAALVTTGASHVAVYNWTFLLGQSLMPAINALLLGSLVRSPLK